MKALTVVIPSIEPVKTVQDFLPEIVSRSGLNQVEFLLVDASLQSEVDEVCNDLGVIYVVSPSIGRAKQLNFGAKMAKHEMLLFLHLDSIPPANYGQIILNAAQNSNDCGCFRLKFWPNTRFLNFWAFFSRFHCRVARGGDQGLFVSKELFQSTGGFDEDLPIMEDVEICHRLEKEGNFQILKEEIQTSSRKYMEHGQYRLQWFFIQTMIKYWLGVSPEKLFKRYQKFLQKTRSK